MTTFKQFITEAHKSSISIEEAVTLLNSSCADAMSNRKLRIQPILRGSMEPGNNSCFVYHGESSSRTSRHGKNFYTVILDEVLTDYPKRSRSIICGNFANKKHVLNYAKSHPLTGEMTGTLYAIVPFDGVQIGVCPEHDMWDTPITMVGETHDAHDWNELFEYFDVVDTSFEALISSLEAAVKNGKEIQGYWGTRTIKKFANVNIREEIIRGYSSANFSLATTADAGKITASWPKEVWISGKCVAIPLSIYQEYL